MTSHVLSMQARKPGGLDACEPFRTGMVGAFEHILQGHGWGPIGVLLVGIVAAAAVLARCRSSLRRRPLGSGPKLL